MREAYSIFLFELLELLLDVFGGVVEEFESA